MIQLVGGDSLEVEEDSGPTVTSRLARALVAVLEAVPDDEEDESP